MGGSFPSDSVATFGWNRWQGSIGISGNLRPEYAGGKAESLYLTREGRQQAIKVAGSYE
jgi:hypothetical protein